MANIVPYIHFAQNGQEAITFYKGCSVEMPNCCVRASAFYTWTSMPAVFTLWAATSKAIRLGWSAGTVPV